MTEPRPDHDVGSGHPLDPGEVTRLLGRLAEATDATPVYDRLLPLIYDELHRLAASFLQRERPDHTLQPTALVNEAFVRLSGQRDAGWESKGHFMAIAATAMRRILVDHARTRGRERRGGGRRPVSLESDVTAVEAADDVDLVALDSALTRLGRFDERKMRIVELRFFVGLTVDDTANALGLSPATVHREWRLAKAWLRAEIEGEIEGDDADG